jgi:hypothetical protein
MRFTTAVYASFRRMVALPLERPWVDLSIRISMGLDRRFGSNIACWQFNRVARKRTNWGRGCHCRPQRSGGGRGPGHLPGAATRSHTMANLTVAHRN